MLGTNLWGLEVKQAKLCEKINLKLEKFEKWDVYITNVKPTFRTTAKDAISGSSAYIAIGEYLHSLSLSRTV